MKLLSSLTDFLRLPVIGQPPLTAFLTTLAAPAGQLEIDGAAINLGSLVAAINAIFYGQDAIMANSNFQTSAGATITLSNLVGAYIKLTNGGAVTVTLDSAYNIVNSMQYPFPGQTFGFQIVDTAATTVATPTLSDTAVTLSGTTTVTTGGFRQYLVQITQLSTTAAAQLTAGTTYTSITQVGTTNNFTLALGTNAISPTVGQCIYINVTAGTLPSGWYSINKVTSATSFVIATPTGTVWTCTAATFPQLASIPQNTTVVGGVPVSGWTQNLPGVYSPLLTITGQMGMAAGVMVT